MVGETFPSLVLLLLLLLLPSLATTSRLHSFNPALDFPFHGMDLTSVVVKGPVSNIGDILWMYLNKAIHFSFHRLSRLSHAVTAVVEGTMSR
uniref:Putative secreted peptide n=1 Tax=Anopheles braziliensis TaxID=58242 RepID=A0A2M3ZSE4_9DIPT